MSVTPPIVPISAEVSKAELASKNERYYYHIVPSESLQRALAEGTPVATGKPHRLVIPIDVANNIYRGKQGTLGRASMDPRSCTIIALVNMFIDAAGGSDIYLEEVLNHKVLDENGEPIGFATRAYRLWILMNDEEFAAFNDHVAQGCSPDVASNPSYLPCSRRGTRILEAPGPYDCSAKAICSMDRLCIAISALLAGQDTRYDQGIMFDPNMNGRTDEELAESANVDSLFDDDTERASRPDPKYFASPFYNPTWTDTLSQDQFAAWGAGGPQTDITNYFVEGSDEFTLPLINKVIQLRRTSMIPNSNALGKYALFMTPSAKEIKRALLAMNSRAGVDKAAYLKSLDGEALWQAFLDGEIRDPMLTDRISVPDVLGTLKGGIGPRAINETWPSLSVWQDYVTSHRRVSAGLGRIAAVETTARIYSGVPDGVPEVYANVRRVSAQLDNKLLRGDEDSEHMQRMIWDTHAYAQYCNEYGRSLSLDGFMMDHMNRLMNALYTLLPPQQLMAMMLWFMSHRTAETSTARPSTAVRAGGPYATGKSKTHQTVTGWFPPCMVINRNNSTYAANTRVPIQNKLVISDEAGDPDPQKNPEYFNYRLSSLSDGATMRQYVEKDPKTNGMHVVTKYAVHNTCESSGSNKNANPILGSRMIHFLFTESENRTGRKMLNIGAIAYKSDEMQGRFANALQWSKSKIAELYEFQSVGAFGDPDMTMFRVLMAIAVERLGSDFLPVRLIEQCELMTHSFAAWRIAMMWELRYKGVYNWRDVRIAQLAFFQTNWCIRAVDAIRAMAVLVLASKTEGQQVKVLRVLKSSQILMLDPHSFEPVRDENNPEYYETCLVGGIEKACAVIAQHITPKIGVGNVAKLMDEILTRKHAGMPIVRWITDTKRTSRLCVLGTFMDQHVDSEEELVLMSALRELAVQSLPAAPGSSPDGIHNRWYARLLYPDNSVACNGVVCTTATVMPPWSAHDSVTDAPAKHPHEDVAGAVVVVQLSAIEDDVSAGVHDFQVMGAVGVLVVSKSDKLPTEVAATESDNITIPVMVVTQKSVVALMASMDAKRDNTITLACASTVDNLPGGCSFAYHMAVTSLFQNPTVQQSGLSPLPKALDDGSGKIKHSASFIGAGWHHLQRRNFVTYHRMSQPVDVVQLYTHEAVGLVGAMPLFPCFSKYVAGNTEGTRMSKLSMDSNLVVNFDELERVLDATTAKEKPISDECLEVYRAALDVEGLTPEEHIVVFNSHLCEEQPTSSFAYTPDPSCEITVRNPSKVRRDVTTPNPETQPKRRRTSFSAFVRPIQPPSQPTPELLSSDTEESEDEAEPPVEATQGVSDEIFKGNRDTLTFTYGLGAKIVVNHAMRTYGEAPIKGFDIGMQTPMDDPVDVDPRFLEDED